MSSDKKMTRTFNNYYFVYEEGILSMFASELSNDPIKTFDVKLNSDKAMEMEIMWICEQQEPE